MTYQVDAIYDTGVFRPLQPLALPDQSRVTITVTEAEMVVEGSPPTKADEVAIVARQRQAAQELDEELTNIADLSPGDGFSSADHDRIPFVKTASCRSPGRRRGR